MKQRAGGKAKKLTPEEFILLALKKLPKPGYHGIHAVFSGFNAAFRKYFPGLDPVKEVNKLVAEGKVSIRPAKGGVIIYKGTPQQLPTTGGTALEKMGLE